MICALICLRTQIQAEDCSDKYVRSATSREKRYKSRATSKASRRSHGQHAVAEWRRAQGAWFRNTFGSTKKGFCFSLVPIAACCPLGSCKSHVRRRQPHTQGKYKLLQQTLTAIVTMSSEIFAASCDISEITAGRDTTRSSHCLSQANPVITDSCSETAPAPTRFIRKQKKECTQSCTFLSKSAIRDAGHVPVGRATWDKAYERNVTSKFHAAHRQYVAKLLASPESAQDEWLDFDV